MILPTPPEIAPSTAQKSVVLGEEFPHGVLVFGAQAQPHPATDRKHRIWARTEPGHGEGRQQQNADTWRLPVGCHSLDGTNLTKCFVLMLLLHLAWHPKLPCFQDVSHADLTTNVAGASTRSNSSNQKSHCKPPKSAQSADVPPWRTKCLGMAPASTGMKKKCPSDHHWKLPTRSVGQHCLISVESS